MPSGVFRAETDWTPRLAWHSRQTCLTSDLISMRGGLRSMRFMAGTTALEPHRSVLESKGTALIRMAGKASGSLPAKVRNICGCVVPCGL